MKHVSSTQLQKDGHTKKTPNVTLMSLTHVVTMESTKDESESDSCVGKTTTLVEDKGTRNL